MSIAKYIFALLCVTSIPAFGMEEEKTNSIDWRATLREIFKQTVPTDNELPKLDEYNLRSKIATENNPNDIFLYTKRNVEKERMIISNITNIDIPTNTKLSVSHFIIYIPYEWFTEKLIHALINNGFVFTCDWTREKIENFFRTQSISNFQYASKLTAMFGKDSFDEIPFKLETPKPAGTESIISEPGTIHEKSTTPKTTKPSHLKYWIGGSIAACTAVIIAAMIYMKMRSQNNEQQEQSITPTK